MTINKVVKNKLKKTKEQSLVVGPIVQKLIDSGWDEKQIVYGKKEWCVPKNPSEATKREKGHSYEGFPVDIVVFDDKKTCGDYRHVLFLIECKQPDVTVGIQQLESYLSLEPHAKLGIWTNSADSSAGTRVVYKNSKGLSMPQKKTVSSIPTPSTNLSEDATNPTYDDIIPPSTGVLTELFSNLLDMVVSRDGSVTRREDQLDQLCNLILLKLDSDKQGKIDSKKELSFHPCSSEKETARHIRNLFSSFIMVYPDIFISATDKEIRFDDHTIYTVVDELYQYNLLEVGSEAVSTAFQVLRSAALKQGEGQYFTPSRVIKAAIKLIGLELGDIIIDPACGTGGFLIQALSEMQERYPSKESDISKWAQLHIYGIDKDAIGIKLTKAIMQIMGDGSAHCVRGDSVSTDKWDILYSHLATPAFQNGRFDKVLTNPPFGENLSISFMDARKAGLSIADDMEKFGRTDNLELGLAMLNRCCDLLKPGGKMCIVLPETYFFSPSYRFVREWAKKRIKPICVANVPMEAFQGFCRAKTNLYIFEKIKEHDKDWDKGNVIFLDPNTCGIYKKGGIRYVVDDKGNRTDKIDDQLYSMAVAYSKGNYRNATKVSLKKVYEKDICVPRYYNKKYIKEYNEFIKKLGVKSITLGELEKKSVIRVFSGHGSPSNDQRNGDVPYIKVSDIRNMRININPSNLIPRELAQKLWRTKDGNSNICAWDIVTPNRASTNIGEFSIVMPGEEDIVLTKEMYVLRVSENDIGIDAFYLLWALSISQVRNEWRRITLMQTNREDTGNRYKEIAIPLPPTPEWACNISESFRKYFISLAKANKRFAKNLTSDDIDYIPSVRSLPQKPE